MPAVSPYLWYLHVGTRYVSRKSVHPAGMIFQNLSLVGLPVAVFSENNRAGIRLEEKYLDL
jgi:hypothetical protein